MNLPRMNADNADQILNSAFRVVRDSRDWANRKSIVHLSFSFPFSIAAVKWFFAVRYLADIWHISLMRGNGKWKMASCLLRPASCRLPLPTAVCFLRTEAQAIFGRVHKAIDHAAIIIRRVQMRNPIEIE